MRGCWEQELRTTPVITISPAPVFPYETQVDRSSAAEPARSAADEAAGSAHDAADTARAKVRGVSQPAGAVAAAESLLPQRAIENTAPAPLLPFLVQAEGVKEAASERMEEAKGTLSDAAARARDKARLLRSPPRPPSSCAGGYTNHICPMIWRFFLRGQLGRASPPCPPLSWALPPVASL